MEDRVQKFRDQLAEWRSRVLFQNLPNETREGSFQEGLKKSREDYYPKFIERLEELKTEAPTNSEIDTVFSALGPGTSWTLNMLDDVRSILYSDLFEFPYTINTALIEQFKKENIPLLQ
jgi:hypothetical protein